MEREMTTENKYKPGHIYYVDGETLNGLLSISRKLACGDKIHVDVRRDYGQWIQARLDNLEEVPDEVEE
jgi:hypothetical protein